MLSQQTGSYRFGIQTRDPHALAARLFAANDGDVASGDAERAGKELDQCLVSSAVYGRGGETNEHGSAALTIDARTAGSRNHVDVDDCKLRTAHADC